MVLYRPPRLRALGFPHEDHAPVEVAAHDGGARIGRLTRFHRGFRRREVGHRLRCLFPRRSRHAPHFPLVAGYERLGLLLGVEEIDAEVVEAAGRAGLGRVAVGLTDLEVDLADALAHLEHAPDGGPGVGSLGGSLQGARAVVLAENALGIEGLAVAVDIGLARLVAALFVGALGHRASDQQYVLARCVCG